MTPFIGSAVSIIGSAVGSIFSPEGKARRQARRLERRQKKAARKAGKITVKQPATRTPYYPPAAAAVVQPTIAEIKAVGGTVPVGTWLKENWFIPAGGVAVIVLIILLTSKKKKVGSRRRNPGRPTGSKTKSSNPGSGSGSTGSRSSKKSTGTFAVRTRRVNREWAKAKASGSKIGRKAAWAKWG